MQKDCCAFTLCFSEEKNGIVAVFRASISPYAKPHLNIAHWTAIKSNESKANFHINTGRYLSCMLSISWDINYESWWKEEPRRAAVVIAFVVRNRSCRRIAFVVNSGVVISWELFCLLPNRALILVDHAKLKMRTSSFTRNFASQSNWWSLRRVAIVFWSNGVIAFLPSRIGFANQPSIFRRLISVLWKDVWRRINQYLNATE